MLGVLRAATRWRAGALLSGAAGAGAYWWLSVGGWQRPGALALGAGVACFAAFSVVRARVRPLVFAGGQGLGGRGGRFGMLRARHWGRLVLPGEWAQAVVELAELLDRVEGTRFARTGFHQAHSDLDNLALLAVAWPASGSSACAPRAGLPARPPPPALLRECADFAGFAHAVYGFVFCSAMGLVRPSLGAIRGGAAAADQRCFHLLTGGAPDDLEFVQMAAESQRLYAPGFALVLDHRRRAIVLAVRGTSGIADTLTDLKCHLEAVEEVAGMSAHAGVRLGARRVLDETREALEQLVTRAPGYRVVVCGHSLGGATAVLVTTLLEAEGLAARVDLQCFAYGAPPVLSSPSPPSRGAKRACFVTVTTSADVVPRLSMWSVSRLLHRLDRLDALTTAGEISRWSRWKATSWLCAGLHHLSEDERAAVARAIDLDCDPSPPGPPKYGAIDPEIEGFWAANAVQLHHPEGLAVVLRGAGTGAVVVDPAALDHEIALDLGGRFMWEHLPNVYHAQLQQAVAREIASKASSL